MSLPSESVHTPEARLVRPKTFNFATDVFDQWTATSPTKEALLWVSHDFSQCRSLSFHHFTRQSHRIGAALAALNVQQGDVAMMMLRRFPAWWEIALAGIRSGIIISPAPTQLSAKDIQYRCTMSSARVFVGDNASIKKYEQVRSQCPSVKVVLNVEGPGANGILSLDDVLKDVALDAKINSVSLDSNSPALIYFTSGTSGPPKMVVHSQTSYPLALRNTGKFWYQLTPDKLIWNTADQGWAKAAWSFFGAWSQGASLFVFDDRGTYSVKHTIDVLNRFPVTTLCAPPLIWRQLTSPENHEYYRQHPPLALEHCTSAGEALNHSVFLQWRELSGVEIHDGYGQTESVLLCGNFKGCPIRPGSMGKPAPGVPLMIIDENGRECKAGVEGDMAIKLKGAGGESNFFGLFSGYANEDGSLTRREKEFVDNGATETWYPTGDRCWRDEDGYIWFVGRADDVINSSGYRIGPFEVESTLKQHAAVAESAVVSSPDAARGEVVKAFIVLNDKFQDAPHPALAKELQTFCKANAAPYKYPRKIEFVSASFLPRTTSGKIQRKELRKLEWRDHKARL